MILFLCNISFQNGLWITKIQVRLLFSIKSINFFHIKGNPNEGIELKIVMNRRIINEVLTTYLPSVFILIIVYSTNFFKPFFFEAVVTVNLTSLLVLTTLFISVSKSLPPTAYVKMIDVWLIFSQLIPFAEVNKGRISHFVLTLFVFYQYYLCCNFIKNQE